MFIWNQIIGIFLFISIKLLAEIVAKVHQKDYDFVKEEKAYVGNPLDNEEGLVYAFCKDGQNIQPFSEGNCTIISGSTPEDLRFCNVTVKSATEQLIKRFFDVRGFGKDKVILQWEEETPVDKYPVSRYGVVDFTNCKLTLIADRISDSGLSCAVPLTDSIFDIRYQNFDDCDNSCRVTLDDKGKVIANPRRNLNSSHYISISYSPTKGRLVVILPFAYVKENVIQVASEDFNGTMKVLKEFPVQKEQNNYTVSVTHQFLTVCSAINLNVYCGQFNDNGTLKFENTIFINYIHQLQEIKVLNLFNGSYLLLYKSGYEREVFITKVNEFGQQIGTIQLPQFSYKFLASDFRSFVNKDRKDCLAIMNEKGNKLNFDFICFKSADSVRY